MKKETSQATTQPVAKESKLLPMNANGSVLKVGGKYVAVNTIHIFECTIVGGNGTMVEVSVGKLLSQTPNTLPKKLTISSLSIFDTYMEAKKKRTKTLAKTKKKKVEHV